MTVPTIHGDLTHHAEEIHDQKHKLNTRHWNLKSKFKKRDFVSSNCQIYNKQLKTGKTDDDDTGQELHENSFGEHELDFVHQTATKTIQFFLILKLN